MDELFLIDNEEAIEITISPNKMQAFLKIESTLVYNITYDGVKKKMYEMGIEHGINEIRIKHIIDNNLFGVEELIAQGDYPIDGEDTKHTYHFNRELIQQAPTIREDGTVDYHNKGNIQNVIAGQVLVTAEPYTRGKIGWDITNREVEPKQGKHVNFPKGKNVIVDTEKNALVATCDGRIDYREGKVNVINTMSIDGDVGIESGNIEFNGSVEVLGNVCTGRSIIAKGNVTVNGTVEAAYIKAGGNIVIARGIQGDRKGMLEADGNITSKFIESSIIKAKGNIITGAILNSEVFCEQMIEVSGKIGQIVGGKIRAIKKIVSKSVGNRVEHKTNITLGMTEEEERLLVEKREEQEELSREIETLQNMMESMKNQQEKMKVLKEKIEKTAFLTTVSKQIEELEVISENAVDTRLDVLGVIYPNVKVSIKSEAYIVSEAVKSVTVQYLAGRVEMIGYEGKNK